MVEVAALNPRVQRILLQGVRACYLVRDRVTALVDCGLPSDAEDLFKGLALAGVPASKLDLLLLTHVHADHGGGAGFLAKENPAMAVIVHEAGAAHLRDPERLNRSVRAAYGSRWEQAGSMLPMGASNPIRSPSDAEIVNLGETKIKVVVTPGHCKHHLSFFEVDSGWLYCGDALGSRYEGMPGFVLSPPFDYDPKQAKASIRLLERLRPKRLLFAHNGPLAPPHDFFGALCDQHDAWVRVVRSLLEKRPDATREELLEGFLDAMPELRNYTNQFFSFGLSVSGIQNHLMRKAVA